MTFILRNNMKRNSHSAEVEAGFPVSDGEANLCALYHSTTLTPLFSVSTARCSSDRIAWVHMDLLDMGSCEPSSQGDELQKVFFEVSKIELVLIAVKEKVGSVKVSPVQ